MRQLEKPPPLSDVMLSVDPLILPRKTMQACLDGQLHQAVT